MPRVHIYLVKIRKTGYEDVLLAVALTGLILYTENYLRKEQYLRVWYMWKDWEEEGYCYKEIVMDFSLTDMK